MKKNLLTRTILSAIVLASAMTTVQCTDSQSDLPADQYLQQIVTFTGNLSDGRVGFEYQAIDDSPVITLTAPGRISEKNAKPGDRLLLTYWLPSDRDPKQGGEVGVAGLQYILTDTVETVGSEPAELGGLYLLTIQRSGEYIDLMAQMPYTDKRKITVNASPLPDSEGLMTLRIDATAGPDADKTFDSPAWASLWIGPVWSRQEVSGVKVIVNNTNNPYRTEFIFKKKSL